MSACRSCDAPIEWVFTEADRRMPLDADPAPDGHFAKVSKRASEYGMTPIVRHLSGAELTFARTNGTALYRSHFATCPDANEHRQGSLEGTS